ncbi:phosphoethanolamine transferase, partial [Escherichia coli]
MSCIKEKSKYAFERAKQFYFMLWCKESLIYLLFSVLVTWCCGYEPPRVSWRVFYL